MVTAGTPLDGEFLPGRDPAIASVVLADVVSARIGLLPHVDVPLEHRIGCRHE
jgi:hypothetical protein